MRCRPMIHRSPRGKPFIEILRGNSDNGASIYCALGRCLDVYVFLDSSFLAALPRNVLR